MVRKIPENKLDKRVVNVWRITAIISSMVVVIFIGGVSVALWKFASQTIAYILLAALLLFCIVNIFVFPKIRYARWRYELTDTEMDIRQGLVVVQRTLIPLVRVQTVETSQGPIMKAQHLASVTIATAGDAFEIPGLTVEDADNLREKVNVLARIAQEDV